jgi:hypothetical protein
VEILMQEYHVKMISFLTMNQNLLQFMRIIKQIKTYLKDKAETQKYQRGKELLDLCISTQ